MDKVQSLVEKLNQQLNSKAGTSALLSTVKMLETELAGQVDGTTGDGQEAIVVDSPRIFVIDGSKGKMPENNSVQPEVEESNVTIHPLSYIERVEEEEVPETAAEKVTEPVPAEKENEPIVAEEEKWETESVVEKEVPAVTDYEVSKKEEIKEPEKDMPVEETTEPPKIVEDLIIDEAEIEAELEEIKEKAEAINKISSHVNPVLTLDFDTEIPTFAHQPPIQEKATEKSPELNEIAGRQNTSYSLNDKLKTESVELSGQLADNSPIKDLRKAIAVNDRFIFLQDLFRNDEVMYNRSLKTINNFSIYPEAEFWIRRELKVKLGWDDKSDTVKLFDQYVRRRFS